MTATRCGSTSTSPPGPGGRGTGRSAATGSCAGARPASRSATRCCTPSTPACCPFADERGGLSFRGRPPEPDRLEYALRAAHAEAAGEHVEFEDGIAERLAVGYGRLASGPVTLLRRYASVAEDYGVAHEPDRHRPRPRRALLLELGDSFVVAERFSVS